MALYLGLLIHSWWLLPCEACVRHSLHADKCTLHMWMCMITNWMVIACSHRWHRQDKTVLSCLCRRCEHICRQDKTRQFCLVLTQFSISKFSVILNILETKQLQIGNWVKITQNCLVLSPVMFTLPTQTRQFCLVRVGGVNELWWISDITHFLAVLRNSC